MQNPKSNMIGNLKNLKKQESTQNIWGQRKKNILQYKEEFMASISKLISKRDCIEVTILSKLASKKNYGSECKCNWEDGVSFSDSHVSYCICCGGRSLWLVFQNL